MINKLKEIFKQYGYIEVPELKKNEKTILTGFDSIFFDKTQKKELYLLKQIHDLNQIDELESSILGFITIYCPNMPLSFNINLILLYSFSDINEITSFEKNKYVCRKIFLNTFSEEKFNDDLYLLPFIPIEKGISVEELNKSISQDIINILDNDENLFNELLKKQEIYE